VRDVRDLLRHTGRNADTSPASLVTMPTEQRFTILPFGCAQAGKLTDVDSPFGALWTLLVSAGLRIGEALALIWEDIDLTRGEVSITKSLRQQKGTDHIGGECSAAALPTRLPDGGNTSTASPRFTPHLYHVVDARRRAHLGGHKKIQATRASRRSWTSTAIPGMNLIVHPAFAIVRGRSSLACLSHKSNLRTQVNV
jgi:integrase